MSLFRGIFGHPVFERPYSDFSLFSHVSGTRRLKKTCEKAFKTLLSRGTSSGPPAPAATAARTPWMSTTQPSQFSRVPASAAARARSARASLASRALSARSSACRGGAVARGGQGQKGSYRQHIHCRNKKCLIDTIESKSVLGRAPASSVVSNIL